MDEEFQTIACKQLFANIITLAVLDACSKPVKRKKDNGVKINVASDRSMDAITFLMDNAQYYVEILNMDGVRFKKQLVKAMWDESENYFTKHITADQRRNFRFNLHQWQNNPIRRKYLKEDEDEIS